MDDSRQRVMDTLKFKIPDRLPKDLGAMGSTGISSFAYPKLVEALGLPRGGSECTIPSKCWPCPTRTCSKLSGAMSSQLVPTSILTPLRSRSGGTITTSTGACLPGSQIQKRSRFRQTEPSGASSEGRRSGGRIVLWGGGINTQTTLPLGSVEDVVRESAEVVAYLKQDGGYVACPIHNILAEIPPEKIIAFYQTAESV